MPVTFDPLDHYLKQTQVVPSYVTVSQLFKSVHKN